MYIVKNHLVVQEKQNDTVDPIYPSIKRSESVLPPEVHELVANVDII